MSLDDEAARAIESEYRYRRMDRNGPWWLGFNCVDADGCFLTQEAPDASEQIFIAREEAEWLLREGLPALLREMDAAPRPKGGKA